MVLGDLLDRMADNMLTWFQWEILTRTRLGLAWVRSIPDGRTEVRADANLYLSSRNHVFSLFCILLNGYLPVVRRFQDDLGAAPTHPGEVAKYTRMKSEVVLHASTFSFRPDIRGYLSASLDCAICSWPYL